MAGRGGYQDPSAAMGMMASAMMMQAMGGGRGGGRGAGAGAGAGTEQGDMICFNWRDYGQCRNGAQCRFKHEDPKDKKRLAGKKKKAAKKKKEKDSKKKGGIVNSDVSSSNSDSDSGSNSGSDSDVEVVDYANLEEDKDGATIQVWDKKKIISALLEKVKNDSGEWVYRWRICFCAPNVQDRSILLHRYLSPEATGPDDKQIGNKGSEKYIQECLDYLSSTCGLQPAPLPLKKNKNKDIGDDSAQKIDRLENILERMMTQGFQQNAASSLVAQTPRGKGGSSTASSVKKSPVTPIERRARKQPRSGGSAASGGPVLSDQALGAMLGAEEPDHEPDNSDDDPIEEDPPTQTLPGFPAVDRNELVQAWNKIETFSTALDTALKDYKQVSPSRMVIYDEANPVDVSMQWMRPERPAGAGDIVKIFTPTEMGHFGMLFKPEDFQRSVDQTVGGILNTMKGLQKPTLRLGELLKLYGVNMTGKNTFKRLVMATALVVSKNARDVAERNAQAVGTPA